MTIIVSKSDGQVVVMRNGIEIGRSVAEVTGHPLDEAVINHFRLPRGFYARCAVRAALRPGTTILITQSRVGTSGGEPITVMDAVVPRP